MLNTTTKTLKPLLAAMPNTTGGTTATVGTPGVARILTISVPSLAAAAAAAASPSPSVGSLSSSSSSSSSSSLTKLNKPNMAQSITNGGGTEGKPKRKRQRLDHLTQEEKIMRRKLKNRMAAQSARDRKKVKMLDLEDEVTKLQRTNEQLMKRNQMLEQKLRKAEEENARLKQQLNTTASALSMDLDVNSVATASRDLLVNIKSEDLDEDMMDALHDVDQMFGMFGAEIDAVNREATDASLDDFIGATYHNAENEFDSYDGDDHTDGESSVDSGCDNEIQSSASSSFSSPRSNSFDVASIDLVSTATPATVNTVVAANTATGVDVTATETTAISGMLEKSFESAELINVPQQKEQVSSCMPKPVMESVESTETSDVVNVVTATTVGVVVPNQTTRHQEQEQPLNLTQQRNTNLHTQSLPRQTYSMHHQQPISSIYKNTNAQRRVDRLRMLTAYLTTVLRLLLAVAINCKNNNTRQQQQQHQSPVTTVHLPNQTLESLMLLKQLRRSQAKRNNHNPNSSKNQILSNSMKYSKVWLKQQQQPVSILATTPQSQSQSQPPPTPALNIVRPNNHQLPDSNPHCVRKTLWEHFSQTRQRRLQIRFDADLSSEMNMMMRMDRDQS